MRTKKEFIAIQIPTGTIRGVLSYPQKYDAEKKFPIIITIVGLNGNRCDLGRILVDMSEKLSENNFFCFRFDFYGLGVSDGFFSEANIHSKTRDIFAVYEFLKNMQLFSTIYFLTLSDGIQALVNAFIQNDEITTHKYIFLSPVLKDTPYDNATNLMTRPHRDITGKQCLPFLGLWMSIDYFKDKKTINFVKHFELISYQIRNSSVAFFDINDEKVIPTIKTLKQNGVNCHMLHGGGHSFNSYTSHWDVIHRTIVYIITEESGEKNDQGVHDKM